MLTVNELIRELQTYAGDLPVWISVSPKYSIPHGDYLDDVAQCVIGVPNHRMVIIEGE